MVDRRRSERTARPWRSLATIARRGLALAVVAGLGAASAFAGDAPATPQLGAEQIVARNVEARGGLDAWRHIRTMVWSGHIESAATPGLDMPFVLEQERPNKTRFELTSSGGRSLRIFDGLRGWTVRPAPGGAPLVQPYSPQELAFARDAQGIDGPLIDYQAKGIAVTAEGIDQIEGRPAYRLDVRMPSGERQHVWIDAKTFLDLKYERTAYTASGAPVTATVFWRNYRSIDGLQVPTTLETGAVPPRVPDRMVIERIALNPPLGDRAFALPGDGQKRSLAAGATRRPEPRRQAVAPVASGPRPGAGP